MFVAVEGCSHGELDRIYESIEECEKSQQITVDLLICCGDFQSVRNVGDLRCMAVPIKYMSMQSFYKYYSGEAKAPVLTIFIGGNHEASNYLQELPYGGWVAPNIYFLGYGGVINVGGLRIGGVSGIYKGHDYLKGRYEFPPYNDGSIRSVYHVRNLEVFRTKQLTSTKDNPVDIFLSHDWPRGVTNFGDADELCRKKKFFREEVQSNNLGSRAAQEMLEFVKPRYWFAGHLHVKFAALVEHNESEDQRKGLKYTRFLALDKCLGNRDFMQILDIVPNKRSVIESDKPKRIKLTESYIVDADDKDGKPIMYYDLEWLTILRLTNHLVKVTSSTVYMPGPGSSDERYDFTPTQEELDETLQLMNNDLLISPSAFVKTADAFDPENDLELLNNMDVVPFPHAIMNPYTVELCEKLGLSDPVLALSKPGSYQHKTLAMTPQRKPSNNEMNVTVNSALSKSFNESVDDISSGDIVFEVSINSDTDGASVGMLTPTGGKGRSRGSLKLSAPTVFDLQSSSDSLPSLELAGPSSHRLNLAKGENSVSDEVSSAQSLSSSLLDVSENPLNASVESGASLVETCNKLSVNSRTESMVSSQGEDSSLDTSTENVSASLVSPKRLLSIDESDVAQVKQNKPSKIRRRNVALYNKSMDD